MVKTQPRRIIRSLCCLSQRHEWLEDAQFMRVLDRIVWCFVRDIAGCKQSACLRRMGLDCLIAACRARRVSWHLDCCPTMPVVDMEPDRAAAVRPNSVRGPGRSVHCRAEVWP